MTTKIKFSIIDGRARVKAALSAGLSISAKDKSGKRYMIDLVGGVPTLRLLDEEASLSLISPPSIMIQIHDTEQTSPDLCDYKTINPLNDIDPLYVIRMLCGMVKVELDANQIDIATKILASLPEEKTIRDFINVADIDNASNLGLSIEQIKTINPLVSGLKKFLN